MIEEIQQISKSTLLPIGMCAALLVGTWALAASWTAAVARTEANSVAITSLQLQYIQVQGKMDSMATILARMEASLDGMVALQATGKP
jgi:hypothetical protein